MKNWILICNPSKYNVIGAFERFEKINWKQKSNFKPSVGDAAYIYIGLPYQEIRYRCRIVEVDLNVSNIDDSEFVIDGTDYQDSPKKMTLKKEITYCEGDFPLAVLKENGLRSVQWSGKLPDSVRELLESKDRNTVFDKELSYLMGKSEEDTIEIRIKAFEKELPKVKKRMKELEVLRQKFVNDYSMQKLKKLTKEEYVVGQGRQDTFCYRIETELQDLGDIHGSPATKFGLYYGKRGNDKEEKFRTVNKYGKDPDKALEQIIEQIIFLLMDGEKMNYEGIRECNLATTFKGKILSTFYPDKYLCIFTDEHLDHFLSCLGITIDSSDDVITKQLKLVGWGKEHPFSETWNSYYLMRFLYSSFGRPLQEKKKLNDEQAERDKKYPREYVSKVHITTDEWVRLLKNPEVFYPENIELVKSIYLCDNHATTCYDLGIKEGKEPSSYITPVVCLGQRIAKYMALAEIIDENGAPTWWRIPFWGRYREDSRFEWKLRPKLAKALSRVYPEVEKEELNDNADIALVSDLQAVSLANAPIEFEYCGMPKEKAIPMFVKGQKVYPRDRRVAINALAHAGYRCEINEEHPTFIRRKSDIPYTEPHHLVPLAFSDKFSVSLDVEENIVSLCSNCHNQIHYGRDAKDLIKLLFHQRQDKLESVGIKLSLKELLNMYGEQYQ